MNAAHTQATSLAGRLVAFAERGPGDAYYRLSRIVARVLVSTRLRQRDKWRVLAENPGVESRLVLQAIRWLKRLPASTPP